MGTAGSTVSVAVRAAVHLAVAPVAVRESAAHLAAAAARPDLEFPIAATAPAVQQGI